VARTEIEKVPVEQISDPMLRSRYYYEKGYIELLSGKLREAFVAFNEGRCGLSGWRWAAHTALLAQTSRVMNKAGMTEGWSWEKIEDELLKALRRARSDVCSLRKAGPYTDEEHRHGERWVQNCLLHLMKPAIALGRFESAERWWGRAIRNWHRMDLSSGWDVGFRSTLLFLRGKLQLARYRRLDGAEEALPYLVRSLVRMVGARLQQPEGCRDLLCVIAEALERKRDPQHRTVRKIAGICVDFSSWFDPYLPTAIPTMPH
jgi:hypothetical protein